MGKKKGLGRGFSSLVESLPSIGIPVKDVGSEKSFTEVSLDEIVTSPYQPRQTLSEESISSLASSIKEFGLLEPVIVRPIENGVYQLVAGHRRFLAARRAGLLTVPAIVVRLTDEEALVFSLIENLQREDLNPIDEGEGYRRLSSEFGFTHQKLADSVGRSRVYVTNTLRLLNLPSFVQDEVRRGRISRGQAIALLSVPKEHLADVTDKVLEDGLSVRQIEGLARNLSGGEVVSAKPRKTAINPKHLELSLQIEKFLNTRVRIYPGKKGGRMEISYYNDDDLSRIARLILPFEDPF